MLIKFDQFFGRQPGVAVRKLSTGYGQVATNCNLRSGALEAFSFYSLIQGGIDFMIPKTVYKMDAAWLFWASHVNPVKAAISDSNHRLLYTGDGYPKQTDYDLATSGGWTTRPTEHRRLGVIKPTTVLTMEPLGTPEEGTSAADTVAYVYTLVTDWGEESDIFTATDWMDVYPGEYIRLKNWAVHNDNLSAWLAAHGNVCQYIRLYRLSSTASGNATYRRVKARVGNLSATPAYNIPIADLASAETYVYDADDGATPTAVNQDLGDELMTEGWDPPPDGLEGLIMFANGMYAGFLGNLIYLNVPGYYYAFPASGLLDYTVETAYDVMALGMYNQMLVVGTTGYPEIISGIDAASTVRTPLPYQQPCLSKQGMVSLPTGVLYPCPDGLFMISGAGGEVVTKQICSRSWWRNLPLSSMICVYYNQVVFIFFEGYDYGFIYDFTKNYIIDIDFDITIQCAFVDPEEDKLYLAGKTAPGGICSDYYGIIEWEGNDTDHMGMVFKTRKIRSAPISLTSAHIVGDFSGGPVTFKLYADDNLKTTRTITSNAGFRLPGGFRACDWEVQLETEKAAIDAVYLATSMEELKNV